MPPRTPLRAMIAVAVALTGCQVHNYLDPEGPRHSGEAAEVSTDREPDALRVVTFNVEWSRRVDEAIARLREDPALRDADVLMLQEMDAEATRQIAGALGFHHVFYPAGRIGQQEFGVAVVSRWAIVEDHKVLLPHAGPVSGVRRIAVGTTLDTPMGPLAVYSVHLETFVMSLRGRLEQAQAVLDDLTRHHGHAGVPCLIGGDFNTPEAHGRDVLRERFALYGFRHATRSLGATADYAFGSLVLDHVFTRDLVLLEAGAEPTIASDHRPVFVVLVRR